MTTKFLSSWLPFFIAIVSTNALATNNNSQCHNCEVVVELDAAKAELFASEVGIISSMPLNGMVVEQGSETSLAKVLVATRPNWGANSFDVANKVLGFAKQPQYGIKTITAVWSADN